jgi:hypothetical protein
MSLVEPSILAIHAALAVKQYGSCCGEEQHLPGTASLKNKENQSFYGFLA